MSTPRQDPLVVMGTPRSSGDVQTGETCWTRGGGRAATIYSGGFLGGIGFAPGSVKTGDHILLYSGGGRLNTVFPLSAASGVAGLFYDAGTVAASGIAVLSGYKIVGLVPANTFGTNVTTGPMQIQFDIPFQSGLCIANISGVIGFTVTYTPESSVLDGGTVVGV